MKRKIARPRVSSLLSFLLILLGLIFLHVHTRQEASSIELVDDQTRKQLIHQYLLFKRTASFDTPFLVKSLMSYWKKTKKPVKIGIAIALMLELDHAKEEADQVLDDIRSVFSPDVFEYACREGEVLPENWQETLEADWVGAKLKAMTFKRLNDQASYASALIELRYYESEAERNFRVATVRELFVIIGTALLISFFISNIHWRRGGKSFFKLRPLHVPLDHLLSFCGRLLLGMVCVEFVLQWLLKGQALWLQLTVPYLGEALFGSILLLIVFFNGRMKMMAIVLEISQLRMRFLNIFHIFGAFSMITACSQLARLAMYFIDWPHRSSTTDYGPLLKEPAGSVFVLTACFVAPIFEEIMFRGFVFRSLLSNMRPWAALLLSSFLFAILHPLESWLVAFAMGFGLSLVYYRTANLLVAIWAHALWNITILIFVYAGIEF